MPEGNGTRRAIQVRLGECPSLPAGQGRIEAIDLARGVAIALMIVSHAVSGLLGIGQVPEWGMVPIHLLTKFSSSLFIMVFGIALAVAFLPKTDASDWPRRRLKLMLRGVEVLFWYKVLTVVEMLPLYGPQDILDTLLYQRFPIWVEILGFYAIALLWLPWVLPLWRRMPLWARLVAPLAVALLAGWLERHFDFWGIEPLKAILVEHDDHYTWGQLSRLPLVMLGLLIGEGVLRCREGNALRRRLVPALAGVGAAMLLGFVGVSLPGLDEALMAVARNAGKHPPALAFMLFSLGGALLVLALCLTGGARAAAWLRPITVVGSDALAAFIFHIVVIFGVFRLLLEAWQVYGYPQVLGIGLALVPATAAWIALTRWIRARS
ncbi:heparan-alpha-glucosaminide N-acetyltransferase domain-containing protein [Halomonas sp. LR5S13]|uniref:heparan-alpha-glucosaminide N-acetyltransferase domain-containing protein n=1 Tax=Halomonas rhizosphaerae TaxID=3043296 RepID=UPI0024A80C0C|nr:heparan-alpha-glucosaminide N-acetyltransferase domain-containing protein [Halomonas rhizosphaerae]MDI5920061.1 heparan-alpha-glucosaminide N-acetyltransferase domain-containing protein [Halomonas rhizosphaerae]